jgi:hypothetical protein
MPDEECSLLLLADRANRLNRGLKRVRIGCIYCGVRGLTVLVYFPRGNAKRSNSRLSALAERLDSWRE